MKLGRPPPTRGSNDAGIEPPAASLWAKFVYPLATSLLARRGGSWSDSLAEAQRTWDQNGAVLESQDLDRGIGDDGDEDGVASVGSADEHQL